MNDAELFTLIKAYLESRMGDRFPLPVADVSQSYQPMPQSRPTAPSLLMSILPAKRYGQRQTSQQWDAGTGRMVRTESQQMESPVQISAWVPFDPATDMGMTAGDLADTAAMVLNSQTFIEHVKAAGAGVLKISDVRKPYFLNDQANYELAPSFDVTITHRRVFVDVAPIVTTIDVDIQRV